MEVLDPAGRTGSIPDRPHVVLVHDVQPDSRDSDAVWRPKVGRSIIFPTTTTLGDYDTAVAPDPAAVDAIGRDPACMRASSSIRSQTARDLNFLEMATN